MLYPLLLTCLMLFSPLVAMAASPVNQGDVPAPKEALVNVVSIYVADMGIHPQDALMREQMVKSLVDAYQFNVVDKPETADAILEKAIDPLNGRPAEAMAVRLVNPQRQVVWHYRLKPGFTLFNQNKPEKRAEAMADKMVEQLIEDKNELRMVMKLH
jgi:hypothetical protein